VVRIALGQIDPTVGDLEGNVDLMIAWAARATEAAADVVVFPELAVTGYPPEDLVLRSSFVDDNLEAVERLARETAGGCAVVTGFVDRSDDGIHNAAGLIANGDVVARYRKIKLPNYGVFDERRTFAPGSDGVVVSVGETALGLSVCEDAWSPGAPFDAYARAGTPIVLNINGSPYHRGKAADREEICRDRALEAHARIGVLAFVGEHVAERLERLGHVRMRGTMRLLSSVERAAEELLALGRRYDMPRVVARALQRYEQFAELFCEERQGFGLAIDESRVERVQSGGERGAGVRVVDGETTYFAHVIAGRGVRESRAADAAAAAERSGSGDEGEGARRKPKSRPIGGPAPLA